MKLCVCEVFGKFSFITGQFNLFQKLSLKTNDNFSKNPLCYSRHLKADGVARQS